MSIPSTGEVRLSQIQTVFGGINPINISEYYTNANPSFTSLVAGLPGTGSLIRMSQFRGKSRANTSDLTKIVNGEAYTLIVAHKAYVYPTSPFPGPSDTFFRSMFSQGYNESLTTFGGILSLADGNNYVNSTMFSKTIHGYLLESYNENGTKFPVWGSFDTTPHTWGSLGSAGAVYNNTYLTCTNKRLYQSTGTSTPVTVGHTAFLTTSKNGASTSLDNPFSDNSGDYTFIGISNKPYTDLDSYDTTTFNAVSGGITAIGIGMSDGSGVGNKMVDYHRRGSTFSHCTAVSDNTPITSSRTTTTNGGSDSTGIFMIWARIMANNSIDLMQYRNNVGLSFQVRVTGSSTGYMWGTDIYTDDSTLSLVVVHTGLVSVGSTRIVTIKILPGQSSYIGSTRYGLTSNSYGNWQGSYSVS